MVKQQVGTLSSRKLDARYWHGAGEDLVELGYAERVSRKKKSLQWYRILKLLPPVGKLDAEVCDHYTRPIGEWLEAVEEELNDLKGEMEEWRSNMQTTGLDSTDKYQEVEEAEDALCAALESFDPGLAARNPNLSSITVAVHPKDLIVSCSHRRKKKRTGREWRAKEVCAILGAIERSVRDVKSPDKQVDEFADLIHMTIQDLGDVEFPIAF